MEGNIKYRVLQIINFTYLLIKTYILMEHYFALIKITIIFTYY